MSRHFCSPFWHQTDTPQRGSVGQQGRPPTHSDCTLALQLTNRKIVNNLSLHTE